MSAIPKQVRTRCDPNRYDVPSFKFTTTTSQFQTASNGVSKSVLLYEPTIEDDGRYLTCRAENAALRNTAMEDQWTIQVHCKRIFAPLDTYTT